MKIVVKDWNVFTEGEKLSILRFAADETARKWRLKGVRNDLPETVGRLKKGTYILTHTGGNGNDRMRYLR